MREKPTASGSMRRYVCVQAHVQKRLNVSAESVGDRTAGNFAAHLMEHVSERTTKEYLWLLKSGWDWAKGKYHISDENPWPETLRRVRIQPGQ
jgi:integrase